MQKRKIKRYDEGGVTDEDLSVANESEDPIATLNERKGWTGVKESGPSNFKDAFAAARKAGDKTFEWKGKKFTTELASEKKAAPKAAPKAEAIAAPTSRYETPYDRTNRENRESGRDFDSLVRGLKDRIMGASERGGDRLLKDAAIRKSEQKFMGSGMKKGGSVSSASRRGDGIAQRGKTRGRLV